MTSRPLWLDAANFAALAHQHASRKDEQTPYFAHPVRVAMIIAVEFGFTDEAILAAALLHDTIEDCAVDYDDILERFGEEVAEYVAVVSKDMRMVEPQREQSYDRQLAGGSWQGRLIKLADTYDNLCDSTTKEAKRRQLERASRAADLAEGDEQLSQARERLLELMKQVKGELEGH